MKKVAVLRDIQVQEKLVSHLVTDSEEQVYKDKLSQNARLESALLNKKLMNWPMARLKRRASEAERAIHSLEENNLQALFLKYLHNEINTISRKAKLKSLAKMRENLHSMRRKIKPLVYSLRLYERCYGRDSMLNTLQEMLRILQDRIGSWHDTQVGLNFLQDYRRQSGNEKSSRKKEYPKGLGNKLQDMSRQYLSEIKDMLHLLDNPMNT